MMQKYAAAKQYFKIENSLWIGQGMKRYSLSSLVLFFFTFSFAGWLWEVLLHVYYDGMLVNRGMLTGPWLPIYGFGGVFVLSVIRRFAGRPRNVFFFTMLMAGVMEYITGSVLWSAYGMRWWDYSDSLINIKGYVCLEGLLIFGTGGLFFLYIAAPKLERIYSRVPRAFKIGLCAVLTGIFLADAVSSVFNPNIGFGVAK